MSIVKTTLNTRENVKTDLAKTLFREKNLMCFTNCFTFQLLNIQGSNPVAKPDTCPEKVGCMCTEAEHSVYFTFIV